MSIIKEFLHEGGIYYHTFSTINDSVTLWDFNHKPLLHYDSSASPMDVRNYPNPEALKYERHIPGERLGRFHWGEQYFSFEYNDGTILESNISIHKAEGLLDFEVIVSKQWISKNIPLGDFVDMDPFDIKNTSIYEDLVVRDVTNMLNKAKVGRPVKQYMDKKRAKKQRRRYDYT